MKDPIGPGTVLAARYEIRARLGQGGFGTVYRALHRDLGVEVALKVLNPDLAANEEARERFLAEVRATTAFVHKRAVQLREFGHDRDRGCLYFTMDLIEGETLRSVLKREGKLAEPRAVRLVSQLLSVLEEAHAVPLVHRDLKPENLMLAHGRSGEEELRVLDFGIAKAVSASQAKDGITQTGVLLGTPYYMSPEQAEGKKLDGRSDLYAVGVILFELIAGRRPIAPDPESEEPLRSFLTNLAVKEPDDLARLVPSVSPSVAAAVRRTLAKKREDRFATAAELRAALTADATARTVALPPPHTVETVNAPALPDTLGSLPTQGLPTPPPEEPRAASPAPAGAAPARGGGLLRAAFGLAIVGAIAVATWPDAFARLAGLVPEEGPASPPQLVAPAPSPPPPAPSPSPPPAPEPAPAPAPAPAPVGGPQPVAPPEAPVATPAPSPGASRLPPLNELLAKRARSLAAERRWAEAIAGIDDLHERGDDSLLPMRIVWETIALKDPVGYSVGWKTPVLGPLGALQFSPDGNSLWWLDRVALKARALDDAAAAIRQLGRSARLMAWSSDGKVGVLLRGSELVGIDGASFAEAWQQDLGAAAERVTSLAFLPGDRAFATLTFGGAGLTTYDARDGRELRTAEVQGRELLGHPESRWLAVKNRAGSLVLFDSGRNEVERDRVPGELGAVEAMAFAPSGKELLVSLGSLLAIVNVEEHARAKLVDAGVRIASVAVSPNGKVIAAGGADGSLVLVAREGKVLRRIERAHRTAIERIAFGPHGYHFATATGELVKVWRFATLPRELALGFEDEVATRPPEDLIRTGPAEGSWLIIDEGRTKVLNHGDSPSGEPSSFCLSELSGEDVTAKVKVKAGARALAGLVLRHRDEECLLAVVDPDSSAVLLLERRGGKCRELARGELVHGEGGWATLSVELRGTRFKATVGASVATAETDIVGVGRVGVATNGAGRFDDLQAEVLPRK